MDEVLSYFFVKMDAIAWSEKNIWDTSGLFRKKFICEIFCVCHRNARFANQQSQQDFVLVCTHPSLFSQKGDFPSGQSFRMSSVRV